MEPAEVERRIGAARVVPVLRSPNTPAAIRAVAACFTAGLDVVELTATTDGWRNALEQARADHPSRVIGVGTVLDATTARDALALGADFLVSPCPAPAVRDVAINTAFVEGGMTVAEVLDAGTRGIAKLFPAHVGGPQFLRSLLAIRPSLRIVPTGGIKLADTGTWLDAGAFAVGVGADLLAQPDPAATVSAVLAGVAHLD